MGDPGAITITSIRQSDHWRVEMKWPHSPPRYFGNFDSQREAEKWIEEHRWMTTRRQEPADIDDHSGDVCFTPKADIRRQ